MPIFLDFAVLFCFSFCFLIVFSLFCIKNTALATLNFLPVFQGFSSFSC